jgi:hypothetical protein
MIVCILKKINMLENQEIKSGANVVKGKGKVTYRGVSEAFSLPYAPVEIMIKNPLNITTRKDMSIVKKEGVGWERL